MEIQLEEHESITLMQINKSVLLLTIKAIIKRTTINRTFCYLINQEFSVINLTVINLTVMNLTVINLTVINLTVINLTVTQSERFL